MPKKISNHIHRYKKINLARKKGVADFLVFKCLKPVCSHWIPLNLAEGKACECNRCGNLMILSKETIKLTLPHCVNCIKRKKADEFTSIAEFLEKVIPPT